MTRPADWPEQMAKAINDRRNLDFAWGSHDCALFACDIVKVVCGIDFAKSLRGRYTTRRGAYTVLRRFAGGGLEQVAEKIARDNDCAEIPPLMARRCDIVLAKVPSNRGKLEDSLGICLGERIAFAGEKGFVQLPITQARRAWRTP